MKTTRPAASSVAQTSPPSPAASARSRRSGAETDKSAVSRVSKPAESAPLNLATIFRWLSAIFFVSAVIAIVTLLISDALNQLRFTSVHRRAGALAFMLIGSSYIGLQLSSRRWKERSKELLLGLAFLLWGTEQFLPANSLATAMDTAVVLIFVVDLSLIIVERLRQRNHE